MEHTPFGTPNLTSTPRCIPNTEEARFVNRRRNTWGRNVSLGPNIEAITMRVEMGRKRKESTYSLLYKSSQIMYLHFKKNLEW
jgi:hypothetical protein